MNNSFGDYIKRLRVQKEMTQKEFSDKTGLSFQRFQSLKEVDASTEFFIGTSVYNIFQQTVVL